MSGAMRTPLGRVRHHGAGHEGTHHFIASRVTSIALLVLAPWFVIAAATQMPDSSYESARAFLAQPLNAIVTFLLLIVSFYHMVIGMQEVIVDYIGKPGTRILLLLLNTFVPAAIAVGALYALLRLNFGG